MHYKTLPAFFGIFALLVMFALPAQAQDNAPGDADSGTFNEKEIAAAAGNFFGEVSEGLASVIEKAFADLGRPNAYIAGTEGSAALGVGLRYGSGTLYHKLEGDSKIYWRGPSIGFDLGGDFSKVFILVYNLHDFRSMYKRFPSGEAGYYFVAGVGISYKQRKDIILAPIRTGVGLRAGINIGWVKFSKKKSIVPF
ncbi:MAG: DUF1134 domain-containing protein [Proteobacteria bacterium]|nr:DUF1134 domain-containing protein [Pseudomonadota bacterium]